MTDDLNTLLFYIIFINLFNSEIVGYRTGSRKNTELVSSSMSTIKDNLRDMQMFHTDREKEIDNQLIVEQGLSEFCILNFSSIYIYLNSN